MHNYQPWWHHEARAVAFAQCGEEVAATNAWALAYLLLSRIPPVARRLYHTAAMERIEENVRALAAGCWPPGKAAPRVHVETPSHTGGVRIPVEVR